MKNLSQIITQFAGSKLSVLQMKQIKGGYGGGNSCYADCPSSSTGRRVECSCGVGETCFATDDVGCGCGSSGLPENGCDA
jgi:hypothetical protein